MRKITFNSALLLFMMFFFAGTMSAVEVFSVKEEFLTAPADNWGFSATSGHVFGYDAAEKRFTVRPQHPSSYSIKSFSNAIEKGDDDLIKVDFIMKGHTSGNANSSVSFYFRDSDGKALLGFSIARISSQWRFARTTSYPGEIAPTANPSYGEPVGVDQPIVKVSALLDMANKTFDFTALAGSFDAETRIFTATTGSASGTNVSFIDTNTGYDFASILTNFYRNSTTTGTIGYDLMYFAVSTEKLVSTAGVTVKFKDQNGDYFKVDEVVETLPVGNEYLATLAQKASYNDGTNVYVLDPSSPTSVASVDAAGSTLELLFRKSPVYESVSWVGSVDENGNLWSDWYQNFVNNSDVTSSQINADHFFGDDGVVKDVVVNNEINVGTGSVVIEDNGYSFTGAGSLKGSGLIKVNLASSQSLTLGLPNLLTGGTEINGGNVTVSKAGALGTAAIIKGVSTITANEEQTLPQLTFEVDGAIIGGNNIIELSGISASEGKKVSISSSYNTNNNYAIGINPVGTLASGSELELNGEGTENKFGLKTASASYLANAKVTLKGNSFLYVEAIQPAGESTINIGTLAGDSESKLGWGRSSALERHINWSVGALNEDSEFAGTITNTGGYKGSGAMYVGDRTNLTKVGTGVLTLSGNSSEANSIYTVNGGTLNVTGAIASATSLVVVSENGTLKGNGSVGGTATINGVLDQVSGYLTLNDVVLAGTLNIKADEANFATVVGTLVQGGVLNVTISQDPSESTSIKLLDVADANISGEFDSVNLPSADYSLSVKSDGIYVDYVKLSTGINNQLVEVKSVQYYNIAGNQVSENSYGILIKKTSFVDGTSKVEKIVNK